MKNIIMFIGTIFSVYYFVRVLLLYQRESHEGPFIIEDKRVVFVEFDENEKRYKSHFQRFSIFDRIRNFFGVYDNEHGDELYYVKNREKNADFWKAEVFTCPHCLAMWVTIPFTLFFTISHFKNIGYAIVYHFMIAGAVSYLYTIADYLQTTGIAAEFMAVYEDDDPSKPYEDLD